MAFARNGSCWKDLSARAFGAAMGNRSCFRCERFVVGVDGGGECCSFGIGNVDLDLFLFLLCSTT